MVRALNIFFCATFASMAAPAVASAPVREILFVGPYGGSGANVLIIRADGSGLRLVARDGYTPRWSPDGTMIVYAQATDTPRPNPTKGLALVPALGGPPRTITTGADSAAAWSPDGRWIAFIRFENRKSNLYVVHPDGSGEREIFHAAGAAAWAPESKRLLIAPRQGLEIVDLVGHAHALRNAACAGGGSWSPNGRWIAFVKCFGKPYNDGIAIEHPDGTGFHWLTRTGSDDNPVWAPDSKRIAYVHFQQMDYLEHTEIRMITLDGKKLGNLDSFAQDHDEYPEWSPDGKQIVFDRDAALEPIGESDRLYVGDARSGGVRKLYDNIARGNQFWRPR